MTRQSNLIEIQKRLTVLEGGLMKFSILCALLSICFLVQNAKSQEYQCYKEIHFLEDTLNITLVSLSYCDCLETVPGDGFVLYSSNFILNESSVLWGKTTLDNSKNKYFLADIDDDTVDELFTLFLDVSNFWGYVHRFTIDSNYSVHLQTLKLPHMLIMDDKPLEELLRINPDKSITLLSRIYESKRSVTIYYDDKNDSLSLIETTP